MTLCTASTLNGQPEPKCPWYLLTGLAAENFSLSGIGTLKSGNYADIILWDPDDFISRADFTDPLAPPSGIQAVYAGGEMI